MDGLNQLAWVADAIKSPLLSPPPRRPASLAVLADEAPSGPPNASSAEASHSSNLRRRVLYRAAQRHAVAGVLSAEVYARALVLLHLETREFELEKDIRAACPGRDLAEQVRVLVAEGAVERQGYGINGDPYRYSITSLGLSLISTARQVLAVDAAAQQELARKLVAAPPKIKKPAKPAVTPQGAENAEIENLPVKRKRKATQVLKENGWDDHQDEDAKPAAPKSRNPSTGVGAIYRALERIKSHRSGVRVPLPTPDGPKTHARVRTLAPPPAGTALTWDHHWARTWSSYAAGPRRERKAVGDILVSIADAVGGAAVTGADLRRIYPGCPDHSKALTTVINAGWVTRDGAGGRYDPFRYTATAAGLAAAAAARAAVATDNTIEHR